MEYLVTMRTHVPDGTTEEAVDGVRSREAPHSRDLAKQGYLRRLWRPPVRPGEWRTLGLFAADDEVELEEVLASMPLRIWRNDEVMPLSPHPNDPGSRVEVMPMLREEAIRAEFLTTLTLTVPEGTADPIVEDTKAREAARARELAEAGSLRRLWTLPAAAGVSRALGLWRARDPAEMQTIVESLPLYAWMAVDTLPLAPHPNDPEMQESSAVLPEP